MTSPGASGRFVVEGIDTETLTLRKADGSLVRVPVASLKRLSVSHGRRSGGAGALRGAFIGATSCAFAGLAIGYMSHDGSFFSQEEMALAMGIVMGGAGAVVGALAGVAAPGERWKAVPLTSLRAGLSFDGGVTAAYTIRF